MIQELIAKEYQRINSEIIKVEQQLNPLPTGTLQCIQDGKYLRWYHCKKGIRKYIPKKKRQFAEQLALRKYFTNQLSILKHEKSALEFYLRHHKANPTPEMPNIESPYFDLLKSYFIPTHDHFRQWMQEAYPKNETYPEQLIYKSSSGNVVRSKSELMIDMFLYMNKIPFRYECLLQIGDIAIFPDFTIMHPTTGKIYYWEHFGMMDVSNYCKNACSKIELYCSHNIIPSINLIMTFETKEHPLNTALIEKIVTDYFL